MRIAILIPVHGDTKAKFTASLGRMLIATMSATINFNGLITKPQIEIFMCSTSRLPEGRQQLAEQALLWGADYILWADADHTFPPDALLRLLAHGKGAIGVNYLRRQEPIPTAITLRAEPIYTTADKAKAAKIEEVGSLGLGLCLIKSQVLKNISKPWFSYEIREDGSVLSEDAYFFWKLRTSGVPVYLDHSLSWQIGHIAEHVVTNADAGSANVDTILPAAGAG